MASERNHRDTHQHYTYLRAALITLGVAAGIAIMAVYGRFNTPVQVALSFALFLVVLGGAFFLVYLTVALLRDRYAEVKGIITLLLIAILLLLFPFIYAPDAPLAVQVQRLAIVPIGIAVAVVVSYVLVRWMEQHQPAMQT